MISLWVFIENIRYDTALSTHIQKLRLSTVHAVFLGIPLLYICVCKSPQQHSCLSSSVNIDRNP